MILNNFNGGNGKEAYIFAPNGDYCLYYPSNLFRNARSFENWGIFNNYSPKAKWILVISITQLVV